MKNIQQFKYVKVWFSNNDDITADITDRIVLSSICLYDLNYTLETKGLSTRTKKKIYNIIIYPVVCMDLKDGLLVRRNGPGYVHLSTLFEISMRNRWELMMDNVTCRDSKKGREFVKQLNVIGSRKVTEYIEGNWDTYSETFSYAMRKRWCSKRSKSFRYIWGLVTAGRKRREMKANCRCTA